MKRNTSTVEILTPEEIVSSLNDKVSYSDLTDNYNLDPSDPKKALSQPGAKKLFDDLDRDKISKGEITHEFNPETYDITKVLSQKGAKELYDELDELKVNFKDLTNEYKSEAPSNKKALSQDGAKLMYEELCDKMQSEYVGFEDVTNEYENVEAPSEFKVLSQKGAANLFNDAALKRDIKDDYENAFNEETLPEEELKNKLFSWKGARNLYRNLVNNFVSIYGAVMHGSLIFPINNIKNGIGIKFSSDEREYKVYAENDLTEKALKVSCDKTDIVKVFSDRNVIARNTIFERNVGANNSVAPVYNITIGDKNGINMEEDKMVFYVNHEPIMHLDSNGLYVFNSTVSTEDKPVNAVSIDVTQPNHGFNNQLVCYFEGVWKIADLKREHTADGWAVRIDNDTFRVYFSGLVHLDDTVRDEEGNKLQIGEYYFVSQEVNGALRRTRYVNGVEQIALKTVYVNGKLKGQLLLTDEANFNLLNDFQLDDEGNVSTVDALFKLIEAVEDLKKDVDGMQERIDDLEGVITDYDKLYENNFVEETFVNHPFLFNAVHNTGAGWETADLNNEKVADAIAIKKDKDTYILITKGTIEIPAGALDDKGDQFISGEYYYVSNTIKGAFSREKSPELDIDQLAFKVITHKEKTKAIILINEETNFDY